MKSYLCCFMFLATICCISSMQVDKHIQEKCMNESQLTEEEIEDPNEKISPSDHTFCYLGCLAENVGFWNDKAEESVEMIGKLDDEEMKKKLKECLLKIGKSERCQAGRAIHGCVKETGLLEN